MSKKIISFFFSILLPILCIAQPANTTAKYSTIQIKENNQEELNIITYKLDSFYTKRVAAGFSGQVLIGYKGNIFYERYFGYADKENERLIDEHSPSQLASTSKPITALAIAILKDRGLLNFDDSVTKYIPAFPYPTITIRNLLTHRSGLPEYFGMVMNKELPIGDSLMSNDSLMSLLIEKKPKCSNQPNTRFKYRNTNYAILSYLVQVISKVSFAQFIQTTIFEPLGMNDSYVFDNTQTHRPNYCKSYKRNWTEQKDTPLDGITGDKSVYSTVQDLYKVDQALYTNKLVQPQTLEEMYSPCSFEKQGYQNYGLGWRMFNYPNQKVIFHNGYWHGNNNCFYRFTTDNFTIIILGNKLNNYIYAHPQAIYNIIMNSNLELTPSEE
jgi:CubicO group peptidase (beta-lactamase class C family)